MTYRVTHRKFYRRVTAEEFDHLGQVMTRVKELLKHKYDVVIEVKEGLK